MTFLNVHSWFVGRLCTYRQRYTHRMISMFFPAVLHHSNSRRRINFRSLSWFSNKLARPIDSLASKPNRGIIAAITQPQLSLEHCTLSSVHRSTDGRQTANLTMDASPSEYSRNSIFSAGEQTIYALASGTGRAGIAVIRISGGNTIKVVHAICKSHDTSKNLVPRRAYLRRFFNPIHGTQIDQGLLLMFPGPHSFTGEDMAEFHVHGGPSVIEGMLDAISSQDCRLAQPGEFTQRAFAAGKMDLTEVEGLADLLAAETEQQRQQALRQLGGETSRQYEKWARKLTRCLAHMEALIDFADDEYDVEYSTSFERTQSMILALREEMASCMDDGNKGEILRSGTRVVLCGAPNVGKSSLLNALARRPAAIVSSTAGTTRDVVEVRLNLSGWPVVVTDTAGLRETSDDIEQEGIVRALSAVNKAQIIIQVVDGESAVVNATNRCGKEVQKSYAPKHTLKNVAEALATSLDEANNFLANAVLPDKQPYLSNMTSSINGVNSGKSVVVVFNKIDCLSEFNLSDLKDHLSKKVPNFDLYFTSCVDGTGIDELIHQLGQTVNSSFMNSDDELGLTGLENVCITRSRHRQHMEACIEHLDKAKIYSAEEVELAAEMVRTALANIGRITGVVEVEKILGVIFQEFCIGK